MQGIFINCKRPKSKKQIKEALLESPASVVLEATSVFGNEYSGSVENAPAGTYDFVGPDPRVKRNFYGAIVKTSAGKVTVK